MTWARFDRESPGDGAARTWALGVARRLLSPAARVARRARVRWDFRRFRRWLARERPRRILVLDLDNTLANTGACLARGEAPLRAATECKANVGVRELVRLLCASDRELRVILLSARPYSFRAVTRSWLAGNAPELARRSLWLVPSPADKLRFWGAAHRSGATVVIIDDLGFGHETGSPRFFAGLIDYAASHAGLYVGYDLIAQLDHAPGSVRELVEAYTTVCGTAAPGSG